MAHISAVVDELDTTCVYVMGDYNADISDDHSMFANHLLTCCQDNGFVLSSQQLLPSNSFTFISNWETVSWLDHCISSSDAHNAIQSMEIYYKYATTDHIPVGITMNVNNIPDMTKSTNCCTRCKLDWSRIKQDDITEYGVNTDTPLKNVKIATDAILCRDVHCKHSQHVNELCSFYEDIVQALKLASQPLYNFSKCNFHCRPGWNVYVADIHEAARDAFLLWKEEGNPRQSPVF